MTTTYIAYRNGSDTLERCIKLALASYRKSFGRWPAAVVVPSSEVNAAEGLVAGLGIAGLGVRGNGGCLATEVWLQVADNKNPA